MFGLGEENGVPGNLCNLRRTCKLHTALMIIKPETSCCEVAILTTEQYISLHLAPSDFDLFSHAKMLQVEEDLHVMM